MAATPLAPSLLVALDTIVDPNFRRSVVFMLHHDAETGGLGLVVNRRTDFAVADLCENLELVWKGAPEACVDWGGPVQPDQGWVLVGDRFAERDDVETVMDGVHWSRSQEVLRELRAAILEKSGIAVRKDAVEETQPEAVERKAPAKSRSKSTATSTTAAAA